MKKIYSILILISALSIGCGKSRPQAYHYGPPVDFSFSDSLNLIITPIKSGSSRLLQFSSTTENVKGLFFQYVSDELTRVGYEEFMFENLEWESGVATVKLNEAQSNRIMNIYSIVTVWVINGEGEGHGFSGNDYTKGTQTLQAFFRFK